MNEQIEALKHVLKTPQRVLIIGHSNPDGDALGSCMALSLFLKKLGHHTDVVMPNDFPDFLKWVPYQEDIVLFSKDSKKVEEFASTTDIIFTLDFNSLSRVGKEFHNLLEHTDKPFVMIDHHLAPENYAEVQFSYPEYGSTAELLYTIMDKLEQTNTIDKDIASCLYLGIMTDTGSFKFSSTTANSHRVVANLMDKGIDASLIQRNTFDGNSFSRLKLLGKAMENLTLIEDCNTAYISLSQAELDSHNFQKGDTEGFVNYGLSIKNVNLAAIFKEDLHLGIVKISFRSKGDFDVNVFARKYFNGGGHKNAAGGKSELSLHETIQKFRTLVVEHKLSLNEAV